MLLFVLSGLLLLRFAERQLLRLLFQLPPRLTRFEPLQPLPLRGGKPRPPQSHRIRMCNVTHQTGGTLNQRLLGQVSIRVGRFTPGEFPPTPHQGRT